MSHICKAALLAALLAALSTAALAQTQGATLSPAVAFDMSGSAPQGIAVGDFNEDGAPDLVGCMNAGYSSGGNILSFLFGDGAGDYGDEVSVVVGYSPEGIAVSDLNGDGHLDFVVTFHGYYGPDAVKVFLGDGAGGLTLNQTLPPGSFPIAATTCDFDEDGVLDVVVAHNVSAGLKLFRGLGGGLFASFPTSGGLASSNGTEVLAGDLNGDGHVDLVSGGAAGITVFFGTGSGQFPTSTTVTGGSYASYVVGVALADLNGDGAPDIVAAHHYTMNVRSYLNDGGGEFTPTAAADLGDNPKGLSVADLTGDDIPDVVVCAASVIFDRFSVFPGVGDGLFAARQDFVTANQPGGPEAADVDLDGDADLLIVCTNAGDTPSVAVHTNLTPPNPWRFLGPGHAGAAGLPLLSGAGSLAVGSTVTVTGSHLASNHASVIVLGGATITLPLFDAVLIPEPDLLIVGVPTGGAGAFALSTTWPAGVPSGATLYAQAWTADAAASAGFSVSNALQLIAP